MKTQILLYVAAKLILYVIVLFLLISKGNNSSTYTLKSVKQENSGANRASSTAGHYRVRWV
jgi:hypothetical protein